MVQWAMANFDETETKGDVWIDLMLDPPLSRGPLPVSEAKTRSGGERENKRVCVVYLPGKEKNSNAFWADFYLTLH